MITKCHCSTSGRRRVHHDGAARRGRNGPSRRTPPRFRRHPSRRPLRRHPKPGKTIRVSSWRKWIARQQERLILDTRLHDQDAVALADELAAADLPDPLTAAALRGLLDRAARATAAQRRQLVAVAGLRGVPLDVVDARYHQLRRQYLLDLCALPDDRRPDPPLSWVRGFTTSDRMAWSCPSDPATLYAIYRLQCDADVLPAPTIGYAATDLETAGPDTDEGFTPRCPPGSCGPPASHPSLRDGAWLLPGGTSAS